MRDLPGVAGEAGWPHVASSADPVFASCLRAAKFAPGTIKAYLAGLSRVETWLSHEVRGATLNDISHDELRAYCRAAATRGLTSSTIAHHMLAVKCYLRFVGRKEIVLQMENTPQGRRLPRLPNDEEIVRLLEAPQPSDRHYLRDRAMLELMYATGIRVGEIRRLVIGDLTPTDLRIVADSGKERHVPVHTPARQKVADYLASRPDPKPGDPMFLSNGGGHSLPSDAVCAVVRSYAKRSKQRVPVYPITIRHCFAAHLLARGICILVLHELLGHSSIELTLWYRRLAPARLKGVHSVFHPRP